MDQFVDDDGDLAAFHFGFRLQDQAVAQNRQRDRLNVLMRDVRQTAKESVSSRRFHEEDGCSRTGSEDQVFVFTAEPHEIDDVRVQLRSAEDLIDAALNRDDLFRSRHRLWCFRLATVQAEHVDFALPIGIADVDAEQKSVQLRFGKPVHAFLLDRVLCGEHHERIG